MHWPEFALASRALRAFGGLLGKRVNGKRKMPKIEFDSPVIHILPLEVRKCVTRENSAVRTLKVGVLDHCHFSLRISPGGRLFNRDRLCRQRWRRTVAS